MSAPIATSARARVLLLIVLVIGQLLSPLLASACDAGASETGSDVAVVDALADVDACGDCCEGGACGSCCLHAPAAPVAVARLMPPRFALVDIALRAPPLHPADYPVESRPPIAD